MKLCVNYVRKLCGMRARHAVPLQKMKKTIATIGLILFPLVALASGGEAHHEAATMDLKFLYTVINFVILALGIYFLLRKSMPEFFANRALTIKMAIDESKKAYDIAFKNFHDLEVKIKNSDVESRELLASVKKQAEIEKEGVIAQALESAEKIKKDVQEIARQEVVKAKQAIKVEAVEMAAELAREKIKQTITAQKQIELGENFASGISQARAS